MKTLKRTTIAILILTLLFSMAIPAMAAEEYTITINNDKDGHTYGAYQIFAGEFSSDSFVNVTWGSGINYANFLTALQAGDIFDNAFDGCTSAAAVAKVLGNTTVIDAAAVRQFADIAGGHLTTIKATLVKNATNYSVSVDPGYYLVKDDVAVTGNDSATMYILDVTKGNTAVTPKSAIPTVEKKVLEDTDVTDRSDLDANYNDVADWDIGQDMSFRLYATIPSDEDLAGYNTYKIVFHDEYSDGITVDAGEFTATYRIGGKETAFVDTSFTMTENTEDNTITYTCTDLIAAMGRDNFLANPTIVITYAAELNADANIGKEEGNPNKVHLEFSNDVYGIGTGNTPEDKVIVFTYELGAKKIDGETKKELAGAKFKLMNGDGAEAGYAVMSESNSVKFLKWGTEAEGTVFESPENGIFTIQGLDAGTYFLKEIDAPEGYNALQDPIELKIAASYSESNADIYKQDWDMTDASTAITTVDLSSGDTSVEDGKVVIENNSGFTLPETGGFGTTLIYVIGGILVIGVSVILITRKRMSNQD